jgi:hypothetical protein
VLGLESGAKVYRSCYAVSMSQAMEGLEGCSQWNLLAKTLQEQGQVEHGIDVLGIRIERALLAINRLGKPTAIFKQVCEIVPSWSEGWSRLHGPPIGSFRLHRALLNSQQIAEIETCRRVVQIGRAVVAGLARRLQPRARRLEREQEEGTACLCP